MSIIWSEKEVEKFTSLLPPLKQNEVYFVSLSARNKYLSEEERKYYMLGRTEMFGRRLVRMNDSYLEVLTSLSESLPSFKTKNGHPIPEEALIVYANINPSCGIRALGDFNQRINTIVTQELVSNGHFEHTNWKKLDTLLMNCYQRSRSRKVFIDIDCDTPAYMVIYDNMLKDFHDHDVVFHTIKTKSGYHVLLERDSIKYNFTKAVEKANLEVKRKFGEGEVIINTNDMTPIPGTVQGGHQVKFL